MSVDPNGSVSKLVEKHDEYIKANTPSPTPKQISPRKDASLLKLDLNSISAASALIFVPPPISRGLPKIDFSSVVGCSDLPRSQESSSSCETPYRDKRVPTPRKTSPRSWISQLSPRAGGSSYTQSLKRPSNSIIHFAGNSEVSETVILEGKKAAHFNKRVIGHLKNKFAFTKEAFEQGIKQIIDTYLTQNKEQSPRSEKALNQILEEIRKVGVLTDCIVNRLRQLQQFLKAYIERKNSKTIWAEELLKKIEMFLNNSHNIDDFLRALETSFDRRNKKLFDKIMGNGYHEQIALIKLWLTSSALEILRDHYSRIKLDFEDLALIPSQKLTIYGEENSMNAVEIAESFITTIKSEGSITINDTPIDLGFLTDEITPKRQLFIHFLGLYYHYSNIPKGESEIEKEVDDIFNSKTVPSTMLFWTCSVAWKDIQNKVNVIFSPLTSQFSFLKNTEKSSLRVDVNQRGYQVLREVIYDCFRNSTSLNCSGASASQGPKIAEIPFRSIVKPVINKGSTWGSSGVVTEMSSSSSSACSSSSSTTEIRTSLRRGPGEKLWKASIRMPSPPTVISDVFYGTKWLLLTRFINFSNIEDASKIKDIPEIESSEGVHAYLSELVKHLDDRLAIANREYISQFTLEYFIKNRCREALIKTSEENKEIDLRQFALEISQGISVDGEILQPFISNLTKFKIKLLDYVMAKTHRVKSLDRDFCAIDKLLKTNNVKDFLRVIERDFENDMIRSLVLHNMIGGWTQNEKGQYIPKLQEAHITSVINTLALVSSGHDFLVYPLNTMMNDIQCYDRDTILGTPHRWPMSVKKSTTIFGQSFREILRTFMVEETPYLEEFSINGVLISGEGLIGTKTEKHRMYYTRVLTEIYKHFDPLMTAEDISKQVEYFLPTNVEPPQVTIEQIPCLKVLQLCTVVASFDSDRYFRWLFNVNDAPFKSNLKPASSCFITIHGPQDFLVDHKKTFRIYQRGIPDRIEGVAINENLHLADIPISWKLSPYREGSNEQLLGILQVNDIYCYPIISAEERSQLYVALYRANKDFLNYTEVDKYTGEVKTWEFLASKPKVQSPLGLPSPTTHRKYRRVKRT